MVSMQTLQRQLATRRSDDRDVANELAFNGPIELGIAYILSQHPHEMFDQTFVDDLADEAYAVVADMFETAIADHTAQWARHAPILELLATGQYTPRTKEPA